MPAGRRSSWKTSSQRRNRTGAFNNTNKGRAGTSAGYTSVYAKQLNPYKSSTLKTKSSPATKSSSLRDSNHSAGAGFPSDDDLGIGKDDDLDLDLGDDDDDLGLDNILSSLEGIGDSNNTKNESGKKAPLSGGNKKDDLGSSSQENNDNFASTNHLSGADTGNAAMILDEKKSSDSPPLHTRTIKHISPVDFGGSGKETERPPIQSTRSNEDLDHPEISPVSSQGEEDNDTMWTDGDATRQYKMMLEADSGNGPAFTSGGFNQNAAVQDLEHMPITGSSFGAGVKNGSSLVGSSLVDSIIDDIELRSTSDNNSGNHSLSEQVPTKKDLLMQLTNSSSDNARTPPRGVGRFSSYRPRDNKGAAPKASQIPTKLEPVIAPAFNSNKSNNMNGRQPQHQFNAPAKSVLASKKPEDETLSTVTDPSESPFIFTYKKAGDDDSVSQITSSLAGNSSMGNSLGSSKLQNVPTNLGTGGRNHRAGLSWMNSNNHGSGPGLGSGRSRMIHRKGGMVGPYGRRADRAAGRRSPGAAAGSGGGRNSRGSSNSGSGSAGSGGASFDGTKSNLDEIAYALNADTATGPGGRKGQRTLSSRVRPRGITPQYPTKSREIPEGANEDLSIAESSTFERQNSHEYIDTNMKSNVSRLGMGGVSTGAQSVSENTVITESSASTLGLLQSMSFLAWKARRLWPFPTSPDVTRRKKFDRSDSMEELEDILMEEGANTLPHRKSRGTRHHGDEEDEEEIDYFSRAMSISNNGGTYSKKKKQRKKYCWKGGTARLGILFFLLTVTFTLYRMPEKESGNGINFTQDPNGRGRFRADMAETDKDRYRYDTVMMQEDLGNNAGQVLDYTTGAMVDSDSGAYRNNNEQAEGIAAASGGVNSRGRLGQPIDNDSAGSASASDSLTSFADEQQEQGHEQLLPEQEQEQQQQEQQQQHFLVNGNVHLPSKFEVLANVDDVLFQRGIDVPFYWHVPRSGGGTMNDVLGSCLHLTLAADAGGGEGHGQEQTLKIIHFGRQVSYVNVDTSTHQGITRAKNLNLVASGLADVVISPLLHEASTLFTPTRRGRMFTVFRHPVERAASLFYFIQETQWRQPATRNDQFADITIETFYKNGFAENNWMTRFLTNELTKGELTEHDLEVAKEVLRQKCLIGLLEEKGETFERIQKYFGWRPKNEEEQSCLEKKLEWSWPMKHKHPEIEEDSKAWRLIVTANKFDMKLYAYARDLFEQQGEQLFPR